VIFMEPDEGRTMSRMELFRCLLCASLGLLGCGGDPAVEALRAVANPTGGCKPTIYETGGGDHADQPFAYFPDCQNPLRREYWHVYATSATDAATVPRLDGERRLAPACGDPAHPLAAIVKKYRLCQEATEQDLATVNHMLLADALTLTHALHQSLRFAQTEDGKRIDPYAYSDDILAACALHPDDSPAAFTELCEREQRLQAAPIAVTYEGPGAAELVVRLNELYGIR
jgi:hypothetical protein